MDEALIRSLWGSSGCNFLFLPSGGIIVMWKEGVVEMVDYLLGAFSVSIKFRNSTDNFEWIFTSVYGVSD